jgi:hypothetical protein
MDEMLPTGRVWFAAVALALAGVSSSAIAAPPAGAPVQPDGTTAPRMREDRTLADALTVEPGTTCLEREALLADIRSWRDDDQIDQRIAIRVRGSSDDPHSLAFAVWFGDELVIERSFDQAPESCTDLHAVVALAIAIALDDALPVELGIVDPPPEPVEQVDAGTGDVPDFTDEPDPKPRRRGPAFAVTIAPAAFVGVAPRASFGGLASFDIRPLEHFDVRLGVLATHLPRFELDALGYEGRVGVTVAAGRVDLCWGTSPRRVRARLCAGVAGGATVSAGHGYTTDFRRSMPWFAGIAGADVAVRLIGPLSLELRVEGVFPFQRTVLDVRSTGGQLLARERFPVAGLIAAVGPRFEF